MRPVTKADIASCMINMSDTEIGVMTFPGLHETLWDEREFQVLNVHVQRVR